MGCLHWIMPDNGPGAQYERATAAVAACPVGSAARDLARPSTAHA